ncbi:MAG: ATP-binding cassette domain-containing protein [Planctomycetota bacterium]
MSPALRPLLEARGLVKSYRKRRVVDRVSLSVRAGEIVGLLGPNGAGKTTCFRMMVGMIPAEEGEVWFEGQNITRLPMYRRARLGLGYLAQEPSVFRKMTVEDNILAVLEACGKFHRSEIPGRLEGLLDELELRPLRRSVAETLSGASGAGSRSPAAWRPSRSCSCSTSPSRPSTRSPSRRSRRSSASSRSGGSRS